MDWKRRKCNAATVSGLCIPALPVFWSRAERAGQAPVDRKSGGSWRAIPPHFLRCTNRRRPVDLPSSWFNYNQSIPSSYFEFIKSVGYPWCHWPDRASVDASDGVVSMLRTKILQKFKSTRLIGAITVATDDVTDRLLKNRVNWSTDSTVNRWPAGIQTSGSLSSASCQQMTLATATNRSINNYQMRNELPSDSSNNGLLSTIKWKIKKKIMINEITPSSSFWLAHVIDIWNYGVKHDNGFN